MCVAASIKVLALLAAILSILALATSRLSRPYLGDLLRLRDALLADAQLGHDLGDVARRRREGTPLVAVLLGAHDHP